MFRFTIRDLLWLMAVIALLARWIAERFVVGKSPAQLRTLVKILESEDIHVTFPSNRVQVSLSTANASWQYDVTIDTDIPKKPQYLKDASSRTQNALPIPAER